jgi:putative membrane protein
MTVTSSLLTAGILTLLTGSVWGQAAPSGSSMPQTPRTSQQPGTLGSERTPGVNPNASDTPSVVDPTTADKDFLREAAQGSATEVALGRMAQEKGSSDAVKEFGKRMVEDHSKAAEELTQVAQMAKLDVRSDVPKKAKRAQDKLSKLSGADFDRAYAKMMVSDHKEDIKAFEREAHSGTVPAVKDFAAKTLPTLQEHLKLAEQLETSGANSSEASRQK